MKIIRLQSSNIMKLVAVDITPKGELVIVGGKNGAGKSSVLNSIAMALGGLALAPPQPIRAGESSAEIKLDLGDLRVIRRFKREEITDPSKGLTPPFHVGWGETTSSLVVTTQDGATYPSPQKVLDALLGKLTFDPLAFKSEEPKKQNEILRRIVGLDFTAINERMRNAFQERTMLKKSLAIDEAQLIRMPEYPDVAAEVSMDEVSAEMMKAEQARQTAQFYDRDVEKAVEIERDARSQLTSVVDLISETERRLEDLRKRGAELEARVKELERVRLSAIKLATAAHEKVPNVASLQARLSEIEAINTKFRANQERAKLTKKYETLLAQIEGLESILDAGEAEKMEQLEKTRFPVDGLSLSDNGVLFNNLPFSQASTAEQLRVSVAIGLALNPKLKVLLIRSGNLLDDDSLRLVAEQAAAADAQVWMEYVTANPEGVSVMIEDGSVAEQAVNY